MDHGHTQDNAFVMTPDKQPYCPTEIKVELLLELMALVAARLSNLAAAQHLPEEQAAMLKARDAMLEQRFQFDPDDRAQVEALTGEFDSYAQILERKLSEVTGSTGAAC